MQVSQTINTDNPFSYAGVKNCEFWLNLILIIVNIFTIMIFIYTNIININILINILI